MDRQSDIAPLTSPQTEENSPVTRQPSAQFESRDAGFTTNIQINKSVRNSIQIPRQWSSGLCDNLSISNLCYSVFCHSWHSALLGYRLGESYFYGCCFPCISNVVIRSYVRAKHNIDGTLCNDLMICTCCNPCSNLQIERELDRQDYYRRDF